MALSELSEEVIVAEAQHVADRIVEWFRDRLAVSEAQRAAADQRVIEVEHLLAASEELTRQLQRALDSRIVIEQAKGMLAERHQATPDEVFEAMRRHARSSRSPLHVLATDIVRGHVRLDV